MKNAYLIYLIFEVYTCKHETCKSNLLENEIDSIKCCNKGTVDLSAYLAKLQRQPDELSELKNGNNAALTKHFIENTWRYNAEMAFGTLVMEKVNILELSLHL